MSWIKDFFDRIFSRSSGGGQSPIIIDIPPAVYYKELAVYNCVNFIGNAVARSEIKTFENGKKVKKEDYFRLNISPNINENASFFWHKVISKMINDGKALVVDINDKLYVAESFTTTERPILGNIYTDVALDGLALQRSFSTDDAYLFRLEDASVKKLIDGMNENLGSLLASSAKALSKSNGQKYKLHISAARAGDDEFNEIFEKRIKKQLTSYLESDNAVYPEFEGYILEPDKATNSKNADDFVKLKTELFKTVATAFHIPESMITGNITSMAEVVSAFLTFGVDPYADVITEVLNKRAGLNNYLLGNYYKVDTSAIIHRDLFSVAPAVSNLISSGAFSPDEVRDDLDYEPINEEWSKKHYMTLNFSPLDDNGIQPQGGDESDE